MKSLLPFAALVLVAATLSPARADTDLEVSMKNISKASRQLGADLKQADDTKHNKAADLQCAATMSSEAQKSSALIPKKEQTLPPDQQAVMTADFKKDMGYFMKDIDALNTDITADRWAAARTDFQKLLDDEKAGHKKFRVQKEEKPGAYAAPAAPTAPATNAPPQ
jgi:cytochrome c556